ncbi:MAG: dTDP-4-dehydrorhamnose 3,5-epimerase [Alphaproteobacteria bacterium]
MQIIDTDIPDVKIVDPGRHMDNRGWLSELWNPAVLAEAGLPVSFAQDNLTHSAAVGVIRALHFQIPPHDQGKLIVCLSGAIYDVALDVRKGSPTFGRHVGVTLRGDSPQQLWIPPGFAHGYCTTEPDTLVFYKLTAPYRAEATGGVLWRDPALAIDWPVGVGDAIVNARDEALPLLADLESPFGRDD